MDILMISNRNDGQWYTDDDLLAVERVAASKNRLNLEKDLFL